MILIQNKQFQSVASLVYLIGIISFTIKYSLYGFDLTDEGLYLTLAYRSYLGDSFISDEFFNAITAFHFLYYPIFKFFPEASLAWFRHISIFVNSIPYLLIFWHFRKQMPSLILIIILSIPFLTNTFMGIRAPGYNSLSSTFLLSSMIMLLISMNKPLKTGNLIAVIAGFLFFCAGISYITLNFLITIPIIFYLIGLRKSNLFQLNTHMFFIISFGVSWMVLLTFIIINGKHVDWFNFALIKSSFSDTSKSYIFILRDLFQNFPNLTYFGKVYLAIAVSIITTAIAYKKNVEVLYSLLIPIHIITIWIVLTENIFKIELALLVIVTLFLPITLILVKKAHINFTKLTYSQVIYFIIWAISASTIYSISTTHLYFERSYTAAYQGLPMAIIFFLILLYHLSVKSGNKITYVLFLIVLTSFTVSSLRFYKNNIYRDDKVFRLNETFKTPKLAKIYSTAEKTATTDSLIYFISSKCKKGDIILAYPSIPMINYLTNTRPAMVNSWMPINYNKKGGGIFDRYDDIYES